ncbi:hypothetical protein SUGI_0789650 [Cryptomeria japonica]|nr:hypothetical protein SUGI_0789650 [Cryptomeria japonica]
MELEMQRWHLPIKKKVSWPIKKIVQKRRQLGAPKPDEKKPLLVEEDKEQAKQAEMMVEEDKQEKNAAIPSQEDVEAAVFVISKVCDPNKATSLEGEYRVDEKITFALERRKSKEGV